MSAKKRQKTKNKAQKKLMPDFVTAHWDVLVILFLLVVPLIYFMPYLSANKMIAGSDFLLGGYPVEKWVSEQEGLPLWYPHVFGGMPVLGTPAGGPLAPFAQLREIIPPHVVMTISFIIAFFAAGIGMYVYLKEIGLSGYAAAVGAVIYQFIGNIATTPYAGHMARALSAALFPLMIFLVHRGLRTRRLLYFVLLSLVTAFAFYDGHFQITYYALIFLIIYGIHYLVVHRKDYSKREIVKVVGYGLCSVALIATLMAAVWLPVYGGLGAGARGVERGYEYATSWAMPPLEIIDLIVPTFSGVLEKYWGLNPFKIHFEYFGILAIAFAILTFLFYRKKSYVKFYALVALIVPFIAFGGATPVFRIFYTIVPGFRLLRAHSMIFFMVSFSIIVLAAIGFHHMVAEDSGDRNKNFKKRFMIAAGSMLGILVLAGIIGAVGRESVITFIQGILRSRFVAEFGEEGASAKFGALANNYSDIVSGTWRSILFLVLALGLVYVSLARKTKVWFFAIAAIAIAFIDQMPLTLKYLQSAPAPSKYYAEDDIVRFLKRDRSIFRVFPFQSQPALNTRFLYHLQDSYLFYHDIQSAGGYVTSPIQRYQEFIGAGKSVMFNPTNLFIFPKFADMLNLKYIVAPNLPEDLSRYDPQSRMIIQNIKDHLTQYRLVFQGYQFSVYQNDRVLPRAYFVPAYRVVDETQSVEVIKSQAFNPHTMVLLEEEPGVVLNESYPDTLIGAPITEYTANRIVCHIESPFPGFLVLADNWHPDWRVFVDGQARELHRANHCFRAVYVDAGMHEVIFRYISPPFNLGSIITLCAVLVAAGLCVILVKYRW
ncbi:MAG: YfhO family protein [candidate division WOR-3 bacterium]|nr:MAG: YfhO family protein [candidate division WOR-3 bacterium]